MSILRWSVTNFERDIASTFVVIQDCLRMGLSLAFPHPNDPPVNLDQYQKLKVDLLNRSVRLNENYSQAAFELRIGRLSRMLLLAINLLPHTLTKTSSVRSIRPLIGIVEHLRREIAWGMPMRKRTLLTQLHESPVTNHYHARFFQSPPITPLPSPPLPFEHPIVDALEGPARALGAALLDATQCVEKTIVLAFHQSHPPARLFSWRPQTAFPDVSSKFGSDVDVAETAGHRGWTFCQRAALGQAESSLVVARDNAREQLKIVFKENHVEDGDVEELKKQSLIPKEALSCCLAMIALLQVRRYLFITLEKT